MSTLIENTGNTSKGKSTSDHKRLILGILAPVKEAFLERAVRDIYPLYNKVSFGSDVSIEMRGIEQYRKSERKVNVYLFYQGSTRYKSLLTDEFYFYKNYTTHPHPWGSWNLGFKNYYTATDIKESVVPLSDFTVFHTKKKVDFSPHKPLWIIDNFEL